MRIVKRPARRSVEASGGVQACGYGPRPYPAGIAARRRRTAGAPIALRARRGLRSGSAAAGRLPADDAAGGVNLFQRPYPCGGRGGLCFSHCRRRSSCAARALSACAPAAARCGYAKNRMGEGRQTTEKPAQARAAPPARERTRAAAAGAVQGAIRRDFGPGGPRTRLQNFGRADIMTVYRQK